MFQSALTSFISAQLIPSYDLDDLKKQFLKIDSNQDGLISLEELTTSMHNVFGSILMKSQDINELFRQLDVN